jgi:hypothetical protein
LTNRQAADRRLTELQASLEAGDLTSVAEGLAAGVSQCLLTRFRERKLILRAPISARSVIAEILLRAAEGCIEIAEFESLGRYLRFSLAVDAAKRSSLEKVYAQLRRMPPCSKADLLAIGEEVFHWYATKVMKGVDLYCIGASVAERERRLHDLNGALNDIGFAIARAVNECSSIALIDTERRLGREQRKHATRLLRRIAKSAGEVNSFEWFFDSVTYGDFVVAECAETPFPVFQLQFADPHQYLIRTLAIRRSLVLTYRERRKDRYLREKLEEIQHRALPQAVGHYLEEVGSPEYTDVDLTRAEAAAKASLMHVAAEDDLLLAASRFDTKVAAYYFAAMGMRWYTVAARAVRDDPRTRASGALASPAIPLDQIACCIDDGADGALVRSALDSLTCELPAGSHFVS